MSKEQEEEPQVYRRPSLNDDDGANDDESEEEVGSRNMRRMMDDHDDEEEDEEIIEATDAELLQEIAKEKKRYEEKKAEFERVKAEMLGNGSLSANDTYTFELNGTFNASELASAYKMPGDDIEADPNAQLTSFQENVITTGSSGSVVLLILLCVLFVVQGARKLYNYIVEKGIEDGIEDVLDEANSTRAEDGHTSALSYTIYNTPFDERELYEKREREGADLRELQQILERRAVRVILRGTKIQEDSQGIKKNWALDMVPKEVWDDFSAAQHNVQREFESIVKENNDKEFDWGPKYKNNILLYAKEKIQFTKRQQMQAFRARANQNNRRPPPNRAPSAKSMLNPGNFRSPPGAGRGARGAGGPSANTPKDFGKGFNKGFLNNNRNNAQQKPNEKLTRRQKKKLKQQQAQQQQQGAPGTGPPSGMANGPPMQNDFNPQAAPAPAAQTNPHRRKKGRRRMK